MKLLPVGTKIKFTKDIYDTPGDTEVGVFFAHAGDSGEIIGNHCKEHYQVTSSTHTTWFGAKRSEFKPIK